MNRLPAKIDDAFTGKDVEAAKKAILSELAHEKARFVFPHASALSHLSADQKEALADLQAHYDTMGWDSLLKSCLDVKKMQVEIPNGLAACEMLCMTMSTSVNTSSNLYASAMELLTSDVANGNLYLALAAIKLSEYYFADCAALLELVKVCPSYHPKALQFLEDKLTWARSSYRSNVLHIGRILKEPDFIESAKSEIPELKTASAEIEAAVSDFKKASEEERFRLTRVWQTNPNLRLLSQFKQRVDPDTVSKEEALLRLPDSVFDKLLKDMDMDSMRQVSLSSPVARRRVETSSAWCCQSARLMEIPTSQCDKSGFDYKGFGHLRELLRLSRSLQTAHFWDISTFDDITNSFTAHYGDMAQMRRSALPHEVSLLGFLQAVKDYVAGDKTGFGTHHLVSKSNLHLTLARLSQNLWSSTLTSALDLLRNLLDSPALGALLWIKELKEIRYPRLLDVMNQHHEPHIPLGLSALIDYYHLIDPASAISHLSEELELRLDRIESSGENCQVAKKFVSGVWRLLWYPAGSWSETGARPYHAVFRVEEADVEVTGRHQEREHQPTDVRLPSQDSMTVHFKGAGFGSGGLKVRGKYANKMIGLEVTRELGSAHHFIGASFNQGFCGSYDHWNPDWESQIISTNGTFLLWKSSALDTESNWNRDLEEVAALEELRLEYIATNEEIIRKPINRPVDTFMNHCWFIRESLLISRGNLRIDSTEMPYDTLVNALKLIPEKMFRSLLPPSKERLAPLPRGHYEDDEIYAMRCQLHDIHVQRLDNVTSFTMKFLAHPSYLHDLRILLSALKGHYIVVQNDFHLIDFGTELQVAAAKRRIGDLNTLHGTEWNDLSLGSMIANINSTIVMLTELEVLDVWSLSAPEISGKLLGAANAVFRALSVYASNTNQRIPGNPREVAFSAERMITKILNNNINTCLPPSECASRPEAGKGTLERLEDDVRHENEASNIGKVYGMWTRRLQSASPSLDYYTRPLLLEELCCLLAIALVPYHDLDGLSKVAPERLVLQTKALYARSEDMPADFVAEEPHIASASPSLTGFWAVTLLGAAIVAFGLGSSFLKKK